MCVVTPHVTPSHSPGSLTHYVGVLLRLDIFLKIVCGVENYEGLSPENRILQLTRLVLHDIYFKL